MRARILFILAALALAAPAAAQQADSANVAMWLRGMCPGTRELRIATTGGERVRGYCGAIESGQLRISLGTRERRVPFVDVDTIWVLERGSGRGASTGALAGALLVGGAGVLLSQGLCEGGGSCTDDVLLLGITGAAAGGAAGALLGAAVGHATRGWRRIYP